MKNQQKNSSNPQASNRKSNSYLKQRDSYLSKTNNVFGSNLFQFLTLNWISPLVSLGSKQPLDQTLIPTLKETDKSKPQLSKFKQSFREYPKNKQSSNKYKNKKLLKSLLFHYRIQFLIFVLLSFSLVGLQMYNSIFSYEVIDYIGSSQRTQAQNIKYFIIFVVVNLAISLLHNYTEYNGLLKALEFSNTLNLMIYDKVLKYSILSEKQFEVSEILNYSQVDAQRFQMAGYYIKETFRSILVLLVGVTLLFIYIGISFLIGISAFLLFCLVSVFLLRIISRTNIKLLEFTDSRIKIAEQILQIIKYIKINILEEYFLEKIGEKRKKQLEMKKKMSISHALNKIAHCLSPTFVIFITLFAYISFNHEMSPGKAFFLIIIFKNIQFSLQRLPQCLTQVIYFWVSLNRIQAFLLATQIKKENIITGQSEDFAVGIENGNFLWQKEGEQKIEKKEKEQNENRMQTQKQIRMESNIFNSFQEPINNKNQQKFPQIQYNQKKYFRALSGINIKFNKNQTTMIIGDIGSGKSSILHAILNQMIVEPNTNVNVTINGLIAYCSQKPWIFCGTVKQNILFYQPYDQIKFNNAIHYACLEDDLKIMPNGIESVIGQKGINLSGGQRARVSLARALYSEKDIYLLDDILSAVDVHVGRFLIENTIKCFLKNKTVIMPTHAVKFLDKADRIVIMQSGRIIAYETYENIQKQAYFKDIVKQSQKEQKVKERNKKQEKGKDQQKLIHQEEIPNQFNETMKDKEIMERKLIEQLILPEEKQIGEVSSQIYFQYIKLNGGKLFVFFICFLMSAWAAFYLISNLQIQKWTNDDNRQNSYLYFYLGYAVISSLFIGANFIYLAFCEVRLGNIFYKTVMKAIVYADINNFFNRVPIGRILNRLSKDVYQLDDITSNIFSNVLLCFFSMVSSLIMSILVSTPYALIPVGIVVFIWILYLNYYIKSQRQCVRLSKMANSPVVNGLSELISGVQTIRAFQRQKQFMDKHTFYVDNNKRMLYTRQSMEYWFYFRISLISLIVNYSIFGYCLFAQNQNASEIGILLTFISTLFDEVQNFLYWFIQFRLKMISIQRLVSLANLPPQSGYENQKKQKKEIIDQHLKGKIQFKNYSCQYRKGLPLSLKNISIAIQPMKKVGIIGRTGAGKSTIVNCILRFLEPASGQLFINGKEIRDYDLKDLRDCITMIQQEPTLMNASFRENLDPAHLYSDEQLIEVLKECNMMNMIEYKGGLNSLVTNSTISVGEKQLLCICRAILKKSCIVLIDQATANVDVNNDYLIQQIIKKGFSNSTVLTIAHRISTLMESDQILVLSEGKVVEWGEASQLRSRPDSIYSKMCFENDKSYLD